MGSQQFCLRWNNHQTNMLSVFDKLLLKEAFVDVTIACEGSSIKAHKIVLSACSPFFEDLFCDNPCKHPIVILRDMSHADLQAIIEFMYKGEINVSQDRLSSLLKTAECLKVKGLAEVTHEDQSHGIKSNDFGVKIQPELMQRSPQTPAANHVNSSISSSSLSHKRKNRVRRNSSEHVTDSASSQPLNKKRPESPKISSPKSVDLKDNAMPVSAEIQHASAPLMASSNITSQSMHSSDHHSPQQMPSNHSVSLTPKEVVKIESSSPTPEIISADPDHDSASNQEYILEPETMMDQGILMKRNNENIMDNDNNEHHTAGTDLPLTMEQDAGPSQDTPLYFPDFNFQRTDASPWFKAKRGPKAAWSDDMMMQAIHDVIVKGAPYKEVAALYKIPLPTLYKYASKKFTQIH